MGQITADKKKLVLLIMAAGLAALSVLFARTTASAFFAVLKSSLVFWGLAAVYMILTRGFGKIRQWIREHRGGVIRILLLEAAMVFYLYFFVFRINADLSVRYSARVTYSILVMELAAVLFFVIEEKKFSILHVYLFLGITLGTMFLFAQPFGTIPDEKTHMIASYDVSNSLMGIGRTKDGSVRMRSDDAAFIQKLSNDSSLTYFWDMLDDPVQSEALKDLERAPFDTMRYQYFPQALGITLGRLLHLGTGAVFLLGRLLNMLWFVLITAFAIRCLPFGKTALAVLALTPMSLQQASSFSYDVFLNSTSFLFVAVTLLLMYGKEEPMGQRKKLAVRTAQIGILLAACILLLPIKGYAYVPLCFLPLMLAVKRWKTHRRVVLFCLGILAVCILLTSLTRIMPTVVQDAAAPAPQSAAQIAAEADELPYTLNYLLANKNEWIYVVKNTAQSLGSFWIESMIGTPLGWMFINLNPVLIYVYVILLVLAALQRTDEETCLGCGEKIWMNVVAWTGVAAILLGMLISYSTLGQRRVNGVQGRYFIPLCFPMLLSIRSKRITASPEIDGTLLMAGLICLFFVMQYLLG